MNIKLITSLLSCMLLANCVTTYDRYGRPVQTVDPVAATIGAVAIGAVAYNAGQNNSNYNSNYRSNYYSSKRCYPYRTGGAYYSPYKGRRCPTTYSTYSRHTTYNNYKRCR